MITCVTYIQNSGISIFYCRYIRTHCAATNQGGNECGRPFVGWRQSALRTIAKFGPSFLILLFSGLGRISVAWNCESRDLWGYVCSLIFLSFTMAHFFSFFFYLDISSWIKIMICPKIPPRVRKWPVSDWAVCEDVVYFVWKIALQVKCQVPNLVYPQCIICHAKMMTMDGPKMSFFVSSRIDSITS